MEYRNLLRPLLDGSIWKQPPPPLSLSESKSLSNSTSQNDHEDEQNQIKGIDLTVKILSVRSEESMSSVLYGHLEGPFTQMTEEKS